MKHADTTFTHCTFTLHTLWKEFIIRRTLTVLQSWALIYL